LDSMLELAIDELNKKNYIQGKQILESILKKDPNHADAWYNLGVCLSEIGLIKDSIEALEKCITLKPDYEYAYVALGFSYSKLGNLELASNALEKAIKLEPNDFYALRNLGGVLAMQGNYLRAITIFSQAMQIKPDAYDIQFGLANAYEKIENFEEASKWYNNLLESDAPESIQKLAEEGLTRISMTELKIVGPRMDAVLYMSSALKKFAKMELNKIKIITFEIAMLGEKGFNINDPSIRYTLDSMEGDFSGLQLVCYMYVGLKTIDPNAPPVADLAEEYKAALEMFGEEKN